MVVGTAAALIRAVDVHVIAVLVIAQWPATVVRSPKHSEDPGRHCQTNADRSWTVELHLKLTQVLHLKVTHLEEPEYGSSVLGVSGVDPLSWIPEPFRRRIPRCPKHELPIRRPSGNR